MRRILSISLLLLFMLPLVSPLFATSATDANVPVCCRRDGKHHCIMMEAIAQRSSDSSKTKTASLHDRCPYGVATSAVINLPFIPDEIQTAVLAGIVCSSAHPTPREALLSRSPDRSNQKRGPPSPVLPLS